jgi:hypothetical protein
MHDQPITPARTSAGGGTHTTGDAEYLMTNTPTIAELRYLNRYMMNLSFPLPMLLALIDAGVNLDTESDATIRQCVHESDSIIELRWVCERQGKVIAILGESGEDGFRPLTRRKAK